MNVKPRAIHRLQQSRGRSSAAAIQGYQHEPGIRNVLRVKRFDPTPAPGLPHGPIYVLDLMVQSEVVPR